MKYPENVMLNEMFINQQYDFEWKDSYLIAYYGDISNRVCDCCYTWDCL